MVNWSLTYCAFFKWISSSHAAAVRERQHVITSRHARSGEFASSVLIEA
jgi:hypothetical protein